MTQRYDRAQLLIGQGRFEMAEREIRQMLAENPDDGFAHALLAICAATDESRYEDATREAELAVAAEPDAPFVHFVRSRVLWKRNHFDEAYESISQAIRLDPYDADYFAQAAQIKLATRDWSTALSLSEQGLAIDPESAGCNNIRTIALERLGRTGEALQSAAKNLKNSPDDSYAHSSHGWALLNSGKYQEAQNAFREALRLDPTNELAREGMIDAISSRSLLFRSVRKFHIALSRLSRKHQFAIIFGAWLLIQVLSGAGDSVPWIRPFIPLILMAYMVFAVLTWTSDAIFNTLLRFHHFGRHLLTSRMIWRSNLVASCLICAAGGAIYSIAIGGWFAAAVVAFYWTLMCVPVTAAFAMPTAKRGLLIGGLGLLVGLLPVYGVVQSVAQDSGVPLARAFRNFNWSIIGLQVAAGYLAVAQNRR
ncbi:MAG: tetratricopeptide repeat protein [Phycisphaera sp. RhM]|nr:tetratricopeptide repeat protein [Phycisphaera sp. RhM]